MQYLIKYRTRHRRYALVKSVSVGDSTRDVEFTVDAAEALTFTTRTDAHAAASELNAYVCPWSRRKRFTAVREDWQQPVRTSREYRPKGTYKANGHQSQLLENAVAVCYARAAAAGLAMPQLPELTLFTIRTTRGASRGGGWRRNGAWQFFIAMQERTFTDARPGYFQYLVAHELAHVADVFHNGGTSHGTRFMRLLKVLCPPELVAYELTYKASAARAVGISTRDALPAVQAAIAAHFERRKPEPNNARAYALQALLGDAFKP